MTKYFAFVPTEQPTIKPLEGANDFEEANNMVEDLQRDGEFVPWIFGREDLLNLQKEIAVCLAA